MLFWYDQRMDEFLPHQQYRGVVFILHRPDNTFLLQLRDEHSPQFPHMWCFPGGRCNNGEDDLNTVIRETKEETGLSVTPESCQILMTRLGGQSHVYICNVSMAADPQVLEGADFQWMTLNEIKQLTLGFWQEDIVPLLGHYLNPKTF